jgi:capsular polysaccharide biosynthesis protein
LNPDETAPRARGFLAAHVWIILFAMVASVLAAVAVFALKPTKYVASSSVMVKPELVNGVPMEAQMGTEAAIASSGSVVQQAANLLHKPALVVRQGLSVSNPVDTTVLTIAFKAATPTEAFNGAGAVTRAYVDFRNSGGDARVADVITAATIPTGPSAVNYTLVVAVAAMCGFLIGVAASVAWDWALGGRAGGQHSGRQSGRQSPTEAQIDPWPKKPWPKPRREANATQREAHSPDNKD